MLIFNLNLIKFCVALAVVRRVQINELTQAIEGLQESWLDLYSNEEKVGHRVE